MPIYEYKCTACGNRFEELVLNSSQKVPCPDCDSDDVERELSLFASSATGCSPSGGFG
ncbi:MAG: zinc ribbon domain-containing protein [Candidatus Krumholzibacteria bacterium]|nr:zinc ribbon domain-containing protein [Candidatus Krumholzibacteria bacterium]